MSTEVLLMSNVPPLGSEGDVVTVADGYARNYLLPKNLAAPVSEATRRRLVKLQAQRAERLKKELGAAQNMAASLENVSCTIAVKTGEEDQLYGSVTASDITASLAEQSITIDRHSVELEHPIKELGCYDVPIRLHPEVTATIKVWVVEE